jgi:hypothetical protein
MASQTSVSLQHKDTRVRNAVLFVVRAKKLQAQRVLSKLSSESLLEDLLIWVAGGCDGGQFGYPKERERPPLKTATKQRLVKT